MSNLVEVKVPDIGDFSDVPVIDLFVKVGDSIKVDDAIATLESDKATMDVPAPVAGTVREVRVKVGDRVGEGSLVLLLEAAEAVKLYLSGARERLLRGRHSRDLFVTPRGARMTRQGFWKLLGRHARAAETARRAAAHLGDVARYTPAASDGHALTHAVEAFVGQWATAQSDRMALAAVAAD